MKNIIKIFLLIFWATSILHSVPQKDLAAKVIALAKKVDLDVRDAKGRNALMKVIQANSYEAAKILIERHIDIDAYDNEGDTALVYAVINNNEAITQLLLDHGASTRTGAYSILADIADREHQFGRSIKGIAEAIKVLFLYGSSISGSDITLQDWMEIFPIDVERAAAMGNAHGIGRLLPMHPTVQQIRSAKKSLGRQQLNQSLAYAIAGGHPEIVGILLQYGADPDAIIEPIHRTPMQILQHIVHTFSSERTLPDQYKRIRELLVQAIVLRLRHFVAFESLIMTSIYEPEEEQTQTIPSEVRLKRLPPDIRIDIFRRLHPEYEAAVWQQIFDEYNTQQERSKQEECLLILSHARLQYLTHQRRTGLLGLLQARDATQEERIAGLRDAIRFHSVEWIKRLAPLITLFDIDEPQRISPFILEAQQELDRTQGQPDAQVAARILEILREENQRQEWTIIEPHISPSYHLPHQLSL